LTINYAQPVRDRFPALVAAVLYADHATGFAGDSPWTPHFLERARARLAGTDERTFPEIVAWRAAFATMGLKPSQYRCASESLLRRLRTEGAVPAIHPLVDLCNAVSMAFAIPIAVFDRRKISGGIEVRPARGHEIYTPFHGEPEHPEPGEIVFADGKDIAHARRWVHRQSRCSAVGPDTASVMIVCEAMHATAARDLAALTDALRRAISDSWPQTAIAMPESEA
jgi:DNA/RNA-binding domain of Phe-tRNA-synthetase-like protein